ncbi:putative GTP-binding protein 6 [Odontomachus brunneus]|uniref:putative GTP-binding protein 6 n=1 Tax=Odontomachus brunneus TaxID=486640 RepID=UPI0013F1C6CF|nr:putative GTP-binding protein 6 [Odontomachus brunneus]
MHCIRKILSITYQNLRTCNEVNNVNRTYKRARVLLQNIACRFNHDSEGDASTESEEERNQYRQLSNHYLGTAAGHRLFVLQPYIKWGRNKKRNTTPELQMAEAVALVNTLPYWCVVGTKYAPLLSLQRKTLIGSGSIQNMKQAIYKSENPTAIFISTNQLKFVQMVQLEKIFGLPVYDRYSIIIHIFREHAKSPEAKLQVALAEIPYIRKKMLETCITASGAAFITEKMKLLLDDKEKKLKTNLKKLQQHRQLIRSRRKNIGMPTVAVIGYTNSGKTTLIKALTNDTSLQPENKLFATLDTTAHQGILLNRLKILYMDTIGFIQDVPETLIEPFVVTLQDAIIADVIVHIYDVSHPDMQAQYEHVQQTIKSMIGEDRSVIDVANKCDLVENDCIPENVIAVSATKLTGIDVLRLEIEKVLLGTTGLLRKRIRVESGSPAAKWFYKWTTVVDAVPDPNNAQYLILNVLVTSRDLEEFKQFLRQ